MFLLNWPRILNDLKFTRRLRANRLAPGRTQVAVLSRLLSFCVDT